MVKILPIEESNDSFYGWFRWSEDGHK
jgi:hypothetical protein